jgi:transposase InsO family protein
MQVSSSGYYEWLKSPKTEASNENETLTVLIKQLFEEGRRNYGTRRIKKGLAARGLVVSRRRIGRLMVSAGLKVKTARKFKVTTDSKHKNPISPNLLNREFDVKQANSVYVGDITYIQTKEGWLYLAVVIDLCSRRIVGFSMASRMKAKLVNDALLAAVWSRKPAKGLIWHTDRGSQYASKSHRLVLKTHAIIQSMSRKGNCCDNAVSESFFHTLKTEETHHCQFKTRADAKASIFEYIEVFYNRKRFHSTNDYLSPVEYEKLLKAA